MSLASADLPSDPEALRDFAAALQAALVEKDRALAARDAELYAKTLHIEKLRAQLAVLRRARFGRSSEKLDRAIEQLELLIGDLEEGQAESETRAEAADADRRALRVRGRPRLAITRRPLPEHLPRETVVHPATDVCPSCGGTALSKLGEDEREVLEYVPSFFKVVRHVRPKLSCRACETIVQPRPAGPRLHPHSGRGQQTAPGRRCRRCRSSVDGPARRCSPTSWSRSTAITSLCTGRASSTPVPASSSIGRPLPASAVC